MSSVLSFYYYEVLQEKVQHLSRKTLWLKDNVKFYNLRLTRSEIELFRKTSVNTFYVFNLFLYSLKTSENKRFPDFFRRYGKYNTIRSRVSRKFRREAHRPDLKNKVTRTKC